MKRCPTCNRDYPDDTLRFCLDDGSILTESPNPYSTSPSHRDEATVPQQWKPDTSSAETLWATPRRPTTGEPTSVYGSPFTQGQPATGGSGKIWLLVGAGLVLLLLAVIAGAAIAYQRIVSANKDTVSSRQRDTRGTNGSTPSATPRATPSATPTPEPQVDIDGTWTGKFDSSNSTMIINENGDNSFTGTITGSDFQIAIAGKVDPYTRKIDFKETKVLKYKGDWKLGTNWGTVSADGRKMSGNGKSVGSYKWSFSKS